LMKGSLLAWKLGLALLVRKDSVWESLRRSVVSEVDSQILQGSGNHSLKSQTNAGVQQIYDRVNAGNPDKHEGDDAFQMRSFNCQAAVTRAIIRGLTSHPNHVFDLKDLVCTE
jgi:hypothetical protein